jgi:sugar lactone lactonase YvrE
MALNETHAGRAGRLFVLELSGGRVFSVNPDGSDKKVITTGGRLPDGIAVDVAAGHIYWTNMGSIDRNDGTIERMDLDGGKRTTIVPEGSTHTIDPVNRLLYWTDRGDPPLGNTVNRAPLDAGYEGRPAPEIVFTHLMEGIGIALDHEGGRMFMTDLARTVHAARLDGSKPSALLVAQGNLSGIAYARLS